MHACLYALYCSWPSVISGLQGASSTATGAEGTAAYAPSCLVPGAGPRMQARVDVAAGLAVPALVILLCMALWALRCVHAACRKCMHACM